MNVIPKIDLDNIPHRTKSKQFTPLDFKHLILQGIYQGNKPQTPIMRRRTMFRNNKFASQMLPNKEK